MTKFYDTSSLLLSADKLFDTSDTIIISSITLKELERIKTAVNKDANIKYAARKLLHKLDENPDKYICHIYRTSMENYLTRYNLDITDDAKILATAADYMQTNQNIKDFIFVTNDISLKKIASIYFSDNNIESVEDNDDYTGYLEVQLNDDEMADFYSNPMEYHKRLGVLVNQYVNIYNSNDQRVDTVCWTGENFR